MSLTNHLTDAVLGSFHGWTIAEAIERTSDHDQTVASGREISSALGGQKIALWDRLSRGKLVATGCFDNPSAPAVLVDPQDFSDLAWSGAPSTTLVGVTESKVQIFNVRVFPVLHSPNAASHLNGLSLAEVFRSYVLDDPEVAELGKCVVKTTNRHAEVFRDGMFPGAFGDAHWRLDATAESIAYNFVTQPFGTDDLLPTPSAMISAVSAVLADRFQVLRQILASGSICAFGTFEETGVEGAIGRLQWTRAGISIDVSNGDLCEGQDYRAQPKWTGLSLRLPDAALPPNQLQNGFVPKTTETPRKANEQIQTKQKSYLECVGWLESLMRASPKSRTEPKNQLWAKAQSKWPKKFGLRAFEAAWTEAAAKAETTAWSAAGRPRKSPHS